MAYIWIVVTSIASSLFLSLIYYEIGMNRYLVYIYIGVSSYLINLAFCKTDRMYKKVFSISIIYIFHIIVSILFSVSIWKDGI